MILRGSQSGKPGRCSVYRARTPYCGLLRHPPGVLSRGFVEDRGNHPGAPAGSGVRERENRRNGYLQTGPAPASTSEVSRTRPAEPRSRGEAVEMSASDDPCPGSFGTEQPEPVVFKAIYHYASRVGHFQTPTPRKPTAPSGTCRLVGSSPYPRDEPSHETSELTIQRCLEGESSHR